MLHPRSGAIPAFTKRHGLEKNDYPGSFVEVKPLFRMASVRALLFFRMASMLKQQEIDLMVTNDLRTSGEFGTVWAHHQQEKLACEKDMRTTAKGNHSRDNCFGLCSCSTRVSGVQMFFLWQVDAWFNGHVEWAWNQLLAKARVNQPSREVILILGSSGLLLANKLTTAIQ